MDNLTKQEREKVLEEFDAKKERQYKAGKVIVVTIALVNIAGTIVSSFINFNLFTLMVQIALSIALLCGVGWVRYFFAIGAALSSFLILYTLAYAGSSVPAYLVVITVIYLVYCIISSIILFASKSVSEFLYSQKNG